MSIYKVEIECVRQEIAPYMYTRSTASILVQAEDPESAKKLAKLFAIETAGPEHDWIAFEPVKATVVMLPLLISTSEQKPAPISCTG